MTGSGPDDGAQVDVEAAWAQIVMHWDDDAAAGGPAAADRVNEAGTGAPDGSAAPDRAGLPPVPPASPAAGRPGAPGWPDPPPDLAPDLAPERREARTQPPGGSTGGSAGSPTGPAPSGASVWRGPTSPPDGLDDDLLDAGGYVPDEPPPLPRGDLVSWLSWGGVLGAPVFLLLAALFWPSAPTLLVATAVTAFVAGFSTLVVRLPARREDDGDDGAVV